MKISKREVVMLTALFLLILAGAYYLFYYMPKTEEIDKLQENISSKTTDIENASITLLRRQSLAIKKDAIEEEFNGVAKYLHEDFSDADILRRIERIITPYTGTMNIEFAKRDEEKTKKAGLTSLRTVQVRLNTSYDNLQEILKAFAEEDAANRIVDFTCNSYSNEFFNREMNVNISVDFLIR